MIKRELKVNLKSFLIWITLIIGLFLVVFLIYPYLLTDDTKGNMDELMAVFPKEILKAFNMDIADINTAFGWMKSEGFIFVLLAICSYASILGTNILLKEESEHTSEYMSMLPVTRTNIVISKAACGTIYIFLMVLLVGAFNYLGMVFSCEFDEKMFALLCITPLFPSLVLFGICLFISTFAKKTKKLLGLGLGLVFISYFLNMLSEMSEKVKFLKYFSTFTLADVRNVILKARLDPIIILVSVVLYIILIICTVERYKKKELC